MSTQHSDGFSRFTRTWQMGLLAFITCGLSIGGSLVMAAPFILALELLGYKNSAELCWIISAMICAPYFVGKGLPSAMAAMMEDEKS
jgi:hypothetical protein